ncbi:MAG: DEAD/DEAH box helicase [Fibromonadaceae bacterium]|nr:DEAD/DEAH box helicase [Fibromonadaceae bacterium]
MPDPCVIVQSNMEVLLNVDSNQHHEARDAIAPFTELVKSPEHFHTYRISHLSLWNAASTGLTAVDVLKRLKQYSSYEIPVVVENEITEYMGRYGILRLVIKDGNLLLECDSDPLFIELCKRKELQDYIGEFISKNSVIISPLARGKLKILLTELGFPVQDLAGYIRGEPLDIELRENYTDSGEKFTLRDYQKDAAQVFYASGSEMGGSGVIVLPCGSGKTIIGMAAMALVKAHTLILTPSVTAARQWIREILQKTNLKKEQVKEYSGDLKEIGPVTIATYQILTQRKRKSKKQEEANTTANTAANTAANIATNAAVNTAVSSPSKQLSEANRLRGESNCCSKSENLENESLKSEEEEFTNFSLFSAQKWGLMIYDEVHLLPAPVFRFSADMQATRRLGLTATLIREDHKETEVFSLIGPKKFDIPWRTLEAQGWIAQAKCHELRVPMDTELRMAYAVAPPREKIAIAGCNPEKFAVVKKLLEKHNEEGDRILIIGQYIEQLENLVKEIDTPLITGKTPNKERDVIYEKFRNGEIRILTVSKVGNFAIDLPDASVLIQISGTFGSRQEEAQRLGRILRPKKDGRQALFYSIVTKDSREQEFAMNRQLFLAEQGYEYEIQF